MRTLGLLALVLGLLALTALLSPWVAWWLVALAGRPFTFGRVYNRVYEVLLVVGIALAWRRLDLGRPADVGFHRAGWARQFGRGLAAGLTGIAAGLTLCALAGALRLELRYPPAKTTQKALLGAGGAAVIGVGEEALFRGVVLRRLVADTGPVAGTAVTTLIYATVHAIRNEGTRGAPFDAWSGLERTKALFAPLLERPALREIVGLTLFGLVLAFARFSSGSLWLPIGVHSAWVAAFRVGRLFCVIGPEPGWLVGDQWPPLVGGVAGWFAVGVTAAVLALGGSRRPA